MIVVAWTMLMGEVLYCFSPFGEVLFFSFVYVCLIS